jgi:anti-sigma factor RsiW
MYRHLCENLDQDLDSPKCREIRRHLDACPECQAYLDSLKKTITLYRMLPTPSVSPTLHRKLIRVLAQEKPNEVPPRLPSSGSTR